MAASDRFMQLLGTMASFFHIGGPTGPGIARSSSKLQARNAANNAMANLEVADPSADTDAATYLATKRRVYLIEFSFDGASPPSPGDNTGKYGLCHTSGGGYTAGAVYYDDGASVAVVAVYKSQVIVTTDAVTGTVSLVADGLYVAETGSAPYTWTLKGDGAPAATGMMKFVELTLAQDATLDSTTDVPDGARVMFVSCDVTTGYTAGGTIAVTIEGSSPVTVMSSAAGDIDPQTIGGYGIEPRAAIGATGTGKVRATIGGTPIAGAATLIVGFIPTRLA